MSCTPQELNQVKQQYSGGSDERFVLTFNRKAIFSEGVKAVANVAEAYWLLDIIGLQAVPIYMDAWLKGKAGVGIFTIDVKEHVANLELSLEDDVPPQFTQKGIPTDFPEGRWTLYLGMDEVGPEQYVTVIYLPEEH